jgi:hypothetical protein
MHMLTTAARSHGKARLGRDYRCLKSKYLSRTAHSNFPAKEDTFWQDDEVVKIIEGKKVFDRWTPTKCPDCHKPIIFDLRKWPHCPECGLIFPNDILNHPDNQLSYAIRKAKEKDRRARDRRLPTEYQEPDTMKPPIIPYISLEIPSPRPKRQHFSERSYVSPEKQRNIDRMCWGLKPI